jgi:hypothetical protein
MDSRPNSAFENKTSKLTLKARITNTTVIQGIW